MADSMEHATGLEKREMLAKAAGNEVGISPYITHILKFLSLYSYLAHFL
jgi:hypothetical protein